MQIKFNRAAFLFCSLALAGFACGGSEKDDPEPEDDAGIVVVTDGGHGISDAGPVDIDAGPVISDGGSGQCTQADQYCNTDDRNGMRCKNGDWVVWTCGEGKTCSRADDGWLSCVPVGGEDGGIDEDAGHDAGIHDAGIEDAGIDDAGIDEPDAGPIEVDGFINIPAGSFTLSHNTGSHSSGDTVTLNAFALKKTPVTVAEFEKCVAANVCSSVHYYGSVDGNYCNYNRGENWKNHPMNCLDWYGAKEYCEWIGGRLPTEEEWEYAATHNGKKHLNIKYPWGDNEPTHCVTAQYFDSSTTKYCQGNAAAPMSNPHDYEGTSDVSLHSPAGDSPLGLVDMIGNVWEWTDSLCTPSIDWLCTSSRLRYMYKGGSNLKFEDELGVAESSWSFPTEMEHYTGVRCAKNFTGYMADKAGNIYTTVDINGQIWMAQNMTYQTADRILHNKDSQTYGYFYTWEDAKKNVCPEGWHLPTKDDFDALLEFVGEDSTSRAAALKATSWGNQYQTGTNSSGFTALPAGYYHHRASGSNYSEFGKAAGFWSDTACENEGTAGIYYLDISLTNARLYCEGMKDYGLSVRCIKDKDAN